MASELRKLELILRPLGYEFIRHKRHGGIHRISDGRKVVSCAGTASDPNWWRQVLRDLQKGGHIPKAKYW